MADPIEAPRRRHRLLIDVQADTPEALRHALDEIAWWADEKGAAASSSDSVMGGGDSGWTVVGEHRPDVTHDSYFAAIAEWKKGHKC